MLYIHGGGFTVGRSEDAAYISSRIAAENGVVVSVNYRLSPEWPFPFGLDDCMAVLRRMQANGALMNGDGSRIVVWGDSAGGNLAAVLPLRAKRDGAPAPVATVLFCPITDFQYERYDSFERLAPKGVVYDTAFMGFIRGAYLNGVGDWSNPLASPALAELHGYPQTLIISGTADPLVDDKRAFARKLKEAGVGVENLVADAMPHGFYFFPGVLGEGDEAYAAVKRFFERIFAA
jgi:acetyl esterase